MSKIPTAEDFLVNHKEQVFILSKSLIPILNIMKEFTKLHVKAALKEATKESEKLMSHSWEKEYENSILNAYPLENIK